MHDSFTLDETDRALVNVLQIAPRVPWAIAGKAIGIDASTAARRWKRLTDAGVAKVVAYPRLDTWAKHRGMAIVEVDCEPATRDHVVDNLVRLPQIASVTVASSGRDLYLTVLTQDLAALSQLVLDQLTEITGIRRTRTHLITRMFSEGSNWRLDALDGGQRDTLRRHAPPRADRDRPLRESDRDLLLALDDARRSVADLATRTATSVSTAQRRLGRVIREGALSFRCETTQAITDWPIAASFWTRVPPNELPQIAEGLVNLPEIRMCAAITGAENLVISLWLRSLADSQRFEEQLATKFPAVTVTDRTISLRAHKRMGCLLDPAGRGTTVIPVDPWATEPVGVYQPARTDGRRKPSGVEGRS